MNCRASWTARSMRLSIPCKASYAAAEARERLMAAEMKGTTKEIGQDGPIHRAQKGSAEPKSTCTTRSTPKSRKRASPPLRSPPTFAWWTRPGPRRSQQAPPCAEHGAGPSWPRLSAASVLAFVCEELDNKLRSPEDIRRWIGNSNVSIIPVIGEAERAGRAFELATAHGRGCCPGSTTTEEPRPTVSSWKGRTRRKAKRCRPCMVPSCFPHGPSSPQALLIASAFPGEGKTTVALNLSYALAKQGKTCLVDADLRKGQPGRRLQSERRTRGWATCLPNATLDKLLLEVPGLSNLSILPAGTLKWKCRPAASAPKPCSRSLQDSARALSVRGHRFRSHPALR